jgi:type 1 glutamine amidotransferase
MNAGTMLLDGMLRQTRGVAPVVVKGGWPQDEAVFDGARSIILFMDGGVRHPILEGDRLELMGRLMAKGVGLACLHYAVEVPKERGGPQLLDWIGGYYERPYSTNPMNDASLERASPRHPISRGWNSFQASDEWYYRIRFRENDSRVTPILTTMLPKDAPNREVVAWATQRADGGRGFGFTGLHHHRNWGHEDFRKVIVNAILWTAKVDIPQNGARCDLAAEELAKNLDDKPAPPARKKKE